jgi:hypothetical protein
MGQSLKTLPLKGIMLEPIRLEPKMLDAPVKANVTFIGGSMDGKEKEATIHSKMNGVVITLKNQESYKYEEPFTFRFIGMKQESEILERKPNWKQKALSKIVKFLSG